MDMLDSSIMKKTVAVLSSKRTKLYAHAPCVVNSYRRKVAGVLSRVNYSIQQNAVALDVIQVLMVGAIFNLAKVNTAHCMLTAALSPSMTVCR